MKMAGGGSGPNAYCVSADYRTQSKFWATFDPQKRILIISFYHSKSEFLSFINKNSLLIGKVGFH